MTRLYRGMVENSLDGSFIGNGKPAPAKIPLQVAGKIRARQRAHKAAGAEAIKRLIRLHGHIGHPPRLRSGKDVSHPAVLLNH